MRYSGQHTELSTVPCTQTYFLNKLSRKCLKNSFYVIMVVYHAIHQTDYENSRRNSRTLNGTFY